MSEKEFKSFRFTDSNDPSDEMLCHLMQQVADQAKEDYEAAESRYFDNLRKEAVKQRKLTHNG